jgi:cytochrome c-type biogenesis protein CcmF
MLSSIGHSFLLVSFIVCVYSVLATGIAYRLPEPRRASMLQSAHRSTVAVFWLITLACLAVIYGFLTNDFSLAYVWGHSSVTQPLAYKISALWSGQSGSLLLWTWMLGAYALAVAVWRGGEASPLIPTTTAVINVVTAFFVGLVTFAANPFMTVEGAVPANGQGLNPLLQNYWMQIHPPTLYAGYVGCTVPFAFAAAAMLHRQTDGPWLAAVRRWTLFPWIVLTVGIIMGGRWAYETLGWGGYWAWDPVENASLMPWLTGTAFLHSIMIQARRGMLKTWNMTLVTLTFLLSIFGTFLTRSGVVSSVHSFAESNIGGYFLAFLAVALVLSVGLIVWRHDDLSSDTNFESPLSREGAFLLNNWILMGATFAVLWGTVYPSISEAITGAQRSVGAPYFNKVMVPLGLILLALTGIGPLMAWRRMSLRSLLRVLKFPILAGTLATPLFYVLSLWQTGAVTAFCLSVFVVAAIGGEFVRGARARHSMTGESHGRAFVNLLLKNRQRYGGYIVHLGIVTLFVGAAGNAFKIETEPIDLKVGETMPVRQSEGNGRISEYALRFDGLQKPAQLAPEKSQEVAAKMVVLRNGQPLRNRDGSEFALYPAIDTFISGAAADPEARAGQEPQTARRPAVMTNLSHDLYLALAGYDSNENTASVKAYLNPLVMWVWISSLFFIGGTAISLLPDRRRAEAKESVTAQDEAPSRVLDSRTARPQVVAAQAVRSTAPSGAREETA